MDKIDHTLADALEKSFSEGLTEKTMECFKKDVEKLVTAIQDDLEWRIKDELAMQLTDWVVRMAERAVEQLLAGNEDQMRRYLSCDKSDDNGQYTGWTGRSDGYGNPSHSVIHGRLFEQGALELRRKVAQANEALIRDERILDLEDQVRSLVEQVNKANAEKEEMWQRVRNAA